MAEPGPGRWLSQSEAADRLGWRLERVRSAARRGRLQRRKDNRSEWLVFVPDDLSARADMASSSADDQGPSSADDQGMAELLAELRAELAEERAARAEAGERAARAAGELVAKEALIAELR